MAVAGAKHITRFIDLMRRDLVGYIDDPGIGVEGQDHTLHARDEPVALTKICQKGNERA
jgi:hypothetical protein